MGKHIWFYKHAMKFGSKVFSDKPQILQPMASILAKPMGLEFPWVWKYLYAHYQWRTMDLRHGSCGGYLPGPRFAVLGWNRSFNTDFPILFHCLMVLQWVSNGFPMGFPLHQEGCMGWSEADVLVLGLLAALRQWRDSEGVQGSSTSHKITTWRWRSFHLWTVLWTVPGTGLIWINAVPCDTWQDT